MAVRRVSAALAVALLIIASIAGCGKDSEGGTTTSNGAPTRLRMQLSWVANAQFAGYMMAKEQASTRTQTWM